MNDAAMDADELAQRYLALWTEYLTALLANPQAIETLNRWMAFAGQFSYPAPDVPPGQNMPFPAWPPFFGPFGAPSAPPVAGAAPDEIAELTRRVAELEQRLDALERKPGSAPARRRDRAGRNR